MAPPVERVSVELMPGLILHPGWLDGPARTRLAASLTDLAEDLRVCARLWRADSLA